VPWRLIGAFLGVMAFAAAIVGGLWKAYDLGAQGERAKAEATLADWKRSVVEQANERRAKQQQRINDLQERFDELRQRPERVRTITKTITVAADDRCRDLSSEWRRLWNAGYESGLRMGTATAAAGLDDASRVAVADAAAVAAEARERFEANAAALTALQTYIRDVVLRRDE